MLKIGLFPLLVGDLPLTARRWGPLIGHGKAFDTSKFFMFCGNALGSPYGSASPMTLNPDTGDPYGPEFPLVTIRDDVKYSPTEMGLMIVFTK